MAVEIPVFVDIDKAFKDAADRVPAAIKPLQSFLDSDENALALKLKIDGNTQMELKRILEDATLSAKNLKTALQDAYSWLGKRAAEGGLDLSKGLTASEKIHLQALGALEYKINGINDASKMMGVVYTANIERAQAKIVELSARIDDLTRKQNKYNLLMKKNAPGSQLNYSNTTKRITEAQAELATARASLGSLTIELEKISAGGKKAAASIGLIRTPAMQMAEEFRRGAAYVDRWNASLGTTNSRLGMLIKSSISLLALHSATNFIRNVRQVTSEFEMQRVALGGIIQDTERAEKLFKQIKAAAIQSPFEIKDLVSFTKQLSAYRIETENLFNVTMRLADISAGLGVDMSRLVLAYGQVRAASVLRGQELRQFTEAGIPLVELLAEKFTQLNHRMVSTAEVFELISQRAVPFRMIEEIFNDMTNAGGIFYKMQEKQAETLKGQWMKLRDALSIMYDEIGNTDFVHGAMETLLKDAMRLLQNWREVSKYLGIAITSLAAYKIALVNARIAANALSLREAASVSALQLNVVGRSKLIAAIFGETAATKAQIVVGNAYVRMKKREMVATNMFTKSLYRLTAALLKNPYAAAIAGVTALVLLFVKLAKSSKEAAFNIDAFQKSTEAFGKASTHAKDISALCDEYDRLSGKSEKTREEQERLYRVTKELAKAYPSAVSGVNAYGDAVEINTQKVRNLSKEEENLMRKVLERRKAQAEAELASLQSRRDEINKIVREGGYTVLGGTDIAPEMEFHKLAETEFEKLGTELQDIITKIKDLSDAIQDADDKLKGLEDDLIGPRLPDFFGDAWRAKIYSYEVLLKGATDKTKAFTKDQVEQFSDAKAAVEEAAKAYDKQTQLVEFYTKALQVANIAQRAQLQGFLDNAMAMQQLYGQILADFNAWDLVRKKESRASQTDPFVTQMQNRMKFMADFRKGYEDLNKYLTSSAALGKESEIMLGRGQSLGLDAQEQMRAAEDLSGWYADMIEKVKKRMQQRGAKGATVTDLLGLKISDSNKQMKDLQQLLQSLWDAKTDFDTSKMKKNLEDQLKRLSDEIKSSETARNFFNNILDMTGDQDLAANMTVSVYGDIGREFKENLQEQLNAALAHFDDGGNANLWDRMRVALGEGDFETIFRYMDRFPEEWQKRLKEMAEADQKYNAELAQNLLKTLERAKSYGEQQVSIAQQTAKRIQDINSLDVSDDIKGRLLKQNAKKEAEETAKLQYEVFKDSPMYVELFANLDTASSRMLHNMRDNLIALKAEWKDLDPTQLKELQSRIDELENQIAARNPFKALIESIKEYQALTKEQSRKQADETAVGLTNYANSQKQALEIAKQDYQIAVEKYGITSDEAKAAKEYLDIQAEETDEAIEQANKAQKTANAYRNAANHIADAAEKMREWAEYVTTTLDGVGEIVATFASDDVSDSFNIISDGIGKTMGGVINTTASAARVFAGDLTAIPSLVKGIGNVISGVFGTAQALKIKKLDKKIEDQQGLLAALEHSYDRLDKAMAKAFGSDYISNYNQQLANLAAQQEAYEEQARLESQKGKKKDEKKVEEYKQSASEVEEAIADMKGQLSEFFAGTDVASAAKEFSDAWIDAYKEFGSTTDAMKESFNDMIQNMITQSVGAKIMQTILQPLFDSIDQMASDGDLSASEIAQIGREAPEYIARINEGMSGLMTSLATAGYDVRQQTAGFTGISRNIAGATEESINGLAAGINTQNFYISYVPTISENVAQILAVLSGNPSPKASPSSTTGINAPEYMQHLPSIDQNLATLLRKVDSVISPNSASTNTHYVAVR